MIRLVQPETVMVELCPARAARLRSGQRASSSDMLRHALGSLFGGGGGPGAELFKLSMQARGWEHTALTQGRRAPIGLRSRSS